MHGRGENSPKTNEKIVPVPLLALFSKQSEVKIVRIRKKDGGWGEKKPSTLFTLGKNVA
jgi:hypothetical protein